MGVYFTMGVYKVRQLLICLIVILVLTNPLAHLNGSAIPIDTEVVKRSVVFLHYSRADLQKPTDEEGATGFLVSIPSKEDVKRGMLVIVTARHVVDPEWAGCPWANPTTISARVNVKDYKPEQTEQGTWDLPLDLSVNGQRNWFSHPDDRVDVAIIPLRIDQTAEIQKRDVNPLALSEFATKEELEKFHVGIGDGITSAGLVPELYAARRNYPAFKFGEISNIPDEPLKLRCGVGNPPKDRLSWLIAGNFVRGNSGSPVFLLPLEFTLGAGLQYSGPRVMIIGLISGSIEGADLGEMVPEEFIFDIIKIRFPVFDLYRGKSDERPKPSPAATLN